MWRWLVAVVVLGLPWGAWAACSETGATQDCFCNCLADSDGAGNNVGGYSNTSCQTRGYPIHTGSTIALCEDFDTTSWDDGTGNAWVTSLGLQAASDFECPNGPGSIDGDEGTDADDCYNFVTNASCDHTGTTNCAVGNQSLGEKYDPGLTHGVFAHQSISGGPLYSYGYTVALMYTPSFNMNTASFKNDEGFNNSFTTRGGPLGQDSSVGCAGFQSSIIGSCNNSNRACDTADKTWATRLFTFPYTSVQTSSFIFQNATATLGTASTGPDGNQWGWAPCDATFPGGAFSWPDGQWACIETKITAWGTQDATRVEQWWLQEGSVRTKIVDISGLDLTNNGATTGETGEISSGIHRIAYNSYTRGPADNGYQGASRDYRYEDNLVITNGTPVSCDVVMAEINGAVATWTVDTFSLVSPSTCTAGSCSAKADVSATASGTASDPTWTWEIDSDCDASNGLTYVVIDDIVGVGGTSCNDSFTCSRTDVCDFSAKPAATYTVTIRSTRGTASGTRTTTFTVNPNTTFQPGNIFRGGTILRSDLYRDPYAPVMVAAPSPMEAPL